MSKAAVSTPTSTSASQWEPKFPFDLVVAYEDKETRQRALHLYDHLAQQLLDDYDFQCSWWKFEHLAEPTLHAQAADAAAEANMIILCLHSRAELPALYKNWIERWLPRRDGRKAALVALIGGDEASEHHEAMTTYLRRVARLGGLDFFDHAFNLTLPPRPNLPPAPAEPHVISAETRDMLYHQMPTTRWGINE